MAKRSSYGISQKKLKPKPKRTSIGISKNSRPKNKHKKRRLVEQYFIDFLARILKKNGKILLSSDENNMKSWILEQFHILEVI